MPCEWEALVAADPAATPAHRAAVSAAIAAVLPGHRAGFVVVEDAAGLAAGVPVVVIRRGPFSWIHALPWVLPAAPLLRPDVAADPERAAACERAVGEGLARLQRDARAVGGTWSCYRAAGRAMADAALAAPAGETRRYDTAVVDLDAGLDAAWRRVDRKTRAELRHAGATLTLAQQPAALPEAYTLHVMQGRAWPHHRPRPLALSQRLLADGVGRLFTAGDARGLLAAAFVLDHPREALVWWSGARPAARRAHAFGFLLWRIVAWAADTGHARVNLGASGGLDAVAAFKRSLGARAVPTPVRWLDASAAGAAGRLVAAAQRWRRRGRNLGERT